MVRGEYGRLYELKKDGVTFFVTPSYDWKEHRMRYEIDRYNPQACVLSRAVRIYGKGFWDYPQYFDSAVHAVKFLKENIDELY